MTGPVLDIRGLDLDYDTLHGRIAALRDVSIEVPEDTVVGIVGESGCGKSTVAAAAMRLLAGNAQVPRGEILFRGRDILKANEAELQALRGRSISMVFQDPMTSQNPVIRVGRQMTDTLYREKLSDREKRARALAMLRKVGMADPEIRFDQYPHEFSGGMRQRISIAMALLVNPQLLIADEPTTALDVTLEAQIVHLIAEMKREFRCSVLFVSHNLGIIAELCDRVVVMYAGEVAERGRVRDIFHGAGHPYTRKLLECDPALVTRKTRHLPVIPGTVPDLRHRPPGCIFAARCDFAEDLCRREPPPEHELAPGHFARCHFAERVAQAKGAAPDPAPAAPYRKAAPGEPVLDVDDLRVRFRAKGLLRALLSRDPDPYVDAVLGVSVSLRRGETFGLVGESGSGKTTLGRAIIGLAQASEGRIGFLGHELTRLSDAAYKPHRANMAMVFQDPVASLSPRRTARALVLEPYDLHGLKVDRDVRAEELFRLVGLSPAFFGRYPHELSGGQARRVGVARALALNPKLVIADEPTAGLDVSVQGEILNLMAELQERLGLAYLIISHNLPVVRHVSDRLGIMYLGRILEQGDAEAIFSDPAHPYTSALLGAIPHPDPDAKRRFVSIEGEVPSLADRPKGCEYNNRCPFATDICRREMPPPTRRDGRVFYCHHPLLQQEGAA